MAKQTINLGAVANDGTGDTPRAAGAKINENFTELYNGQAALPPLIDAAAVQSVAKQMLTGIAGNSLGAAMKWATDRYTSIAEQILANALADNPMTFPLVTPTTRMDQYACYGYSSQTSTTILADLPAQFFIPLVMQGIKLDHVFFPALFENDLIAGFSVATMMTNAERAIRLARTYFPGCRVSFGTPAPSYLGYNTTVWADIVAALLALDNDKDIMVADLSSIYEDPANPSKPITLSFTGSISGTTLTVSTPPGDILPVGCRIRGAGFVSASITDIIAVNADGTGTYKLDGSRTVTSQAIMALPFGDEGPHPNGRGALRRARAEAAMFRRMSKAWVSDYVNIAPNALLHGSTAASGTNVTGTMISGMTIYGHANVNVACVAQDPGFQFTISGLVDRTGNYFAGFALPAITGFFTEELVGFVEIEIVSGGQNIRHFAPDFRLWDGSNAGASYWVYGAGHQTLSCDPEYNNGDVLTLRQGPFVAKAGIFTQAQQFLYVNPKQKIRINENIVLKVRRFGYLTKGLPKSIPVTTATLTFGRVVWNDRLAMFDRAAGGVEATLPAAIGSGDVYAALIKSNLSSGQYRIKVANSTDIYVGSLSSYSEDSQSSLVFKPASDGDTLTLNGGTTGGREGDIVFFVDEAPGKWAISGSVTVPTGSTAATPFSATV